MENGDILDQKITASSFFNINMAPSQARLNQNIAWGALTNIEGEWLQVELNFPTITGVILQGRSDRPQWVKQYRVTYSIDGLSWKNMEDYEQRVMVRVLNERFIIAIIRASM